MAEVTLEGGDIVVRLKLWEAVATFRRELRLPIGWLRMVQVDESPLGSLSLRRAPGAAWPGLFAIGGGRRNGRREFAAVYGKGPALVLELKDGPWDRVIVSQAAAPELAAQLATLLLGRAPGKPGGRGALQAPLD